MAWRFFTSTGKEKVVEEVVPPGLILPFAGSTAPDGWLFCSGQEVSRTTYPRLDGAIGTTYGSYTNGSGSAGTSHLRLPDLRGRVPVGCHAGSGNRTDTNGPLTGTGQVTGGSTITAVTLGTWSGQESVTLTASESGLPAHNHSVSVASHDHAPVNQGGSHQHGIGYSTFNRKNSGSNIRAVPSGNYEYSFASGGPSPGPSTDTKSSGYTTTRSNSATAASSAHTNMAASIVLNFMIRAI